MKLNLIFFCLINFAFLSAEELLTCFLHRHGWCYFEEKTIGYDAKSQFAAKNIPSKDVKNVIFEKSLIREVPAVLFSSFVNLEKLRMIGQNVEDIRPNTFLSAKKLLRLNLSSNKIKSLKTGAFDGAEKLEELFMCCGLLTEINKESLRDLRFLKTISFSGNQIKSIHKNAFEDLDQLRSISLNSNQLNFIHKNLFSYNENLEVIYLNENNINSMANTMFTHLYKLDYLYLVGNKCISKDYPPFPKTAPVARTQYSSIENDLLVCANSYELAEIFYETQHY